MPPPDSPPRLDPAARATRFGCGALLGLLLAAATLAWWWPTPRPVIVLVAVAGAAVFFGWAAMRFGDRFWLFLRNWLWLWW